MVYWVVDDIVLCEIYFEFYFISGDYDFLMKFYIFEGEDVGCYINDNFLNIEGIECIYMI